MRTQGNRPGVETEAIKSSAGELNSSSLAARSDIAPYDYPFDPIYEAKLLAWAQGWESRHAEVDRLNYEADLWFYCYANRKRPGDYYTHQTNQLWAEASK